MLFSARIPRAGLTRSCDRAWKRCSIESRSYLSSALTSTHGDGYDPLPVVSFFVMILFSTATGTVAPQLTGLLMRTFFDRLTDQTQLGLNPYTIAALLEDVAIGQACAAIGHTYFDASLSLVSGNLMRWNVMKSLFTKPPLKALPSSVGDCANRLSADAGPPVILLRQTTYLISAVAFTFVAFVTMFQTNVTNTFVVFLPVALVMGMFRLASNKFGRLWDANRKAAGGVSHAVEKYGQDVDLIAYYGSRSRDDARENSDLNIFYTPADGGIRR